MGATEGVAYARFAEGWTGCSREGGRANFAVLDMRWEAEELLDGKVYEEEGIQCRQMTCATPTAVYLPACSVGVRSDLSSSVQRYFAADS